MLYVVACVGNSPMGDCKKQTFISLKSLLFIPCSRTDNSENISIN
jgi:hypothetical protein